MLKYLNKNYLFSLNIFILYVKILFSLINYRCIIFNIFIIYLIILRVRSFDFKILKLINSLKIEIRECLLRTNKNFIFSFLINIILNITVFMMIILNIVKFFLDTRVIYLTHHLAWQPLCICSFIMVQSKCFKHSCFYIWCLIFLIYNFKFGIFFLIVHCH